MKNMKIRVPMIIISICLELTLIIGLIVNMNIYGSEHLYIKRPWYMFWKRRIVIPK